MLNIFRDEQGVPHVEASQKTDLYRGQGFVHATDRGLQMLLMRTLSQGRLSELLDGGDAALDADVFFRRMNWSAGLETQLALLDPEEARLPRAYCEGASEAFANRYPWEFRLFGYRPEPWRPEHAIALSRMVGYLSMAQSQANMERLLVEMVRSGVDRPKLESLFPGLLEGLDTELLRKLALGRSIIPPEVSWLAAASAPVSSNNWVIAGWRTASGKPLLANDPHLEGNRLPNIWQELVLRLDDRYAMGASMPGGPGIIVGRNRSLAWGVTYSVMDAVELLDRTLPRRLLLPPARPMGRIPPAQGIDPAAAKAADRGHVLRERAWAVGRRPAPGRLLPGHPLVRGRIRRDHHPPVPADVGGRHGGGGHANAGPGRDGLELRLRRPAGEHRLPDVRANCPGGGRAPPAWCRFPAGTRRTTGKDLSAPRISPATSIPRRVF